MAHENDILLKKYNLLEEQTKTASKETEVIDIQELKPIVVIEEQAREDGL